MQLNQIFPKWNQNNLVYADSYLRDLFSNSEDDDYNLKRLKKFISEEKFIHSLAVVGAYAGFFSENKNLIRILILIEILLVDIPDTIGDLLEVRKYEDSKNLYSLLPKILEGLPIKFTVPREVLTKTYGFVLNLTELLRKEIEILVSSSNESNWNAVRNLIITTCVDYGECVSIMHLRDVNEKSSKANNYLNESRKHREVISIFNHPMLWFNSQGSSVGVFGLLVEFFAGSELTQVKSVHSFYDQLIPFIHVFIDDLIDIAEDEKNNDFNIVKFLLEYKVYDFHTSEEEKLYDIIDRLVELYKSKVFELKKDCNKKTLDLHTGAFADMLLLYKIRAEIEGSVHTKTLKYFIDKANVF